MIAPLPIIGSSAKWLRIRNPKHLSTWVFQIHWPVTRFKISDLLRPIPQFSLPVMLLEDTHIDSSHWYSSHFPNPLFPRGRRWRIKNVFTKTILIEEGFNNSPNIVASVNGYRGKIKPHQSLPLNNSCRILPCQTEGFGFNKSMHTTTRDMAFFGSENPIIVEIIFSSSCHFPRQSYYCLNR